MNVLNYKSTDVLPQFSYINNTMPKKMQQKMVITKGASSYSGWQDNNQ